MCGRTRTGRGTSSSTSARSGITLRSTSTDRSEPPPPGGSEREGGKEGGLEGGGRGEEMLTLAFALRAREGDRGHCLTVSEGAVSGTLTLQIGFCIESRTYRFFCDFRFRSRKVRSEHHDSV